MGRDPETRWFLSRVSMFATARDADSLCRDLAAGVRDAMGSDAALIGLRTPTKGVRFCGTEAREAAPDERSIGERAMREMGAVVELGRQMVVAAPICAGDETIGVLVARSSHASLFASETAYAASRFYWSYSSTSSIFHAAGSGYRYFLCSPAI